MPAAMCQDGMTEDARIHWIQPEASIRVGKVLIPTCVANFGGAVYFSCSRTVAGDGASDINLRWWRAPRHTSTCSLSRRWYICRRTTPLDPVARLTLDPGQRTGQVREHGLQWRLRTPGGFVWDLERKKGRTRSPRDAGADFRPSEQVVHV